MSSKLDVILDKFPGYYNILPTSGLYKFISAIADELDMQLDDIDRIDDAIGIDTTRDDDLEFRWGSLLNIEKLPNEPHDQYRSRIKNSITSMSGGTAKAIQYAIAVGLGINNDQDKMNEIIAVYDGWKYDEQLYNYGHVVITIDMQGKPYDSNTENIVVSLANESKAAGVAIHYVPLGFVLTYYIDTEGVTYQSLSELIYDNLGKE